MRFLFLKPLLDLTRKNLLLEIYLFEAKNEANIEILASFTSYMDISYFFNRFLYLLGLMPYFSLKILEK